VNEAEERFAERLARDLEHVLGVGIAVDDVELGVDGAHAFVRAALLIEGRVETIDATASDILGLYRPIVERAAELRLAAAFWRMVGPT
jgi:hypothetical protein